MSVRSSFVNDLKEEVNCTCTKFSAEQQKRKHQGKEQNNWSKTQGAAENRDYVYLLLCW